MARADLQDRGDRQIRIDPLSAEKEIHADRESAVNTEMKKVSVGNRIRGSATLAKAKEKIKRREDLVSDGKPIHADQQIAVKISTKTVGVEKNVDAEKSADVENRLCEREPLVKIKKKIKRKEDRLRANILQANLLDIKASVPWQMRQRIIPYG